MPDPDDLSELTAAERLAHAVLLFHGAPTWDEREKRLWIEATGQDEATTRVLCDLACEVKYQFDGPPPPPTGTAEAWAELMRRAKDQQDRAARLLQYYDSKPAEP